MVKKKSKGSSKTRRKAGGRKPSGKSKASKVKKLIRLTSSRKRKR